MSEKQKINRINKLLICLIIMFIIVTVFYVMNNSKSVNTTADTTNVLNNELVNNEIDNNSVENVTNSAEIVQEELDFYSEEVQGLFPITGAFPTANLSYLIKLRNMERDSINNDTILKLAFSKVTKDDWASSYESETEQLNIDADLLDKYINQIFGKIDYKKDNFNNEDIKYDNNIAGIYNINYNEEENKYYIDINTGDVDQSIIEFLYPKAIKTSDKIEITIHPIYIRNCGEVQDEDGNNTFSYIVYKHYNFETNSFVSRITDTINEIWQYNEETGEEEYNKLIQGIQEKDLETYVLIYNYNENTDKYEFSSLISR